MSGPEILTLEETATYLRLNEQTTYRLLRAGKLPGIKIGHQWRIVREELETFMRGETSAAD